MQAQNSEKYVNTHGNSKNAIHRSHFIKYMEQQYNGMEGMHLGLPQW